MGIFLFLLIVAIVAVAIIRSSNSKKRSAAANKSGTDSGPKEPRDFLEEALGWIKTPKPLRQMLEQNRERTIDMLIQILQNGGIYERKYAAFSLGQIGDARALPYLQRAFDHDPIKGVKEAAGSALVGIRLTPPEKGFSEFDRRRRMQEDYSRQ